MNHDPLCPVNRFIGFPDPTGLAEIAECRCRLIATVREEENKKVRHLRDRIARLEDKANYWRDENVKLRAQLKEKS